MPDFWASFWTEVKDCGDGVKYAAVRGDGREFHLMRTAIRSWVLWTFDDVPGEAERRWSKVGEWDGICLTEMRNVALDAARRHGGGDPAGRPWGRWHRAGGECLTCGRQLARHGTKCKACELERGQVAVPEAPPRGLHLFQLYGMCKEHDLGDF